MYLSLSLVISQIEMASDFFTSAVILSVFLLFQMLIDIYEINKNKNFTLKCI